MFKRRKQQKLREQLLAEEERTVALFHSELEKICREIGAMRNYFGNSKWSHSALLLKDAIGMSDNDIVDLVNKAFKTYDKRHVEKRHPDIMWRAEPEPVPASFCPRCGEALIGKPRKCAEHGPA